MAAAPDRALKGMVLAAGLGTRLRPLTDHFPKPLVPFAGTTPLALAMARLTAAGCRQYAVNSHHLPDQIDAFLKACGVPAGDLQHSHEPTLLGTGGAYNPLRAWVGDDDLLVLNGDVVAPFAAQALVATHRRRRAVATMALLPAVIPGESAVYFRRDAGIEGTVLGFGRDAPPTGAFSGNFACAQVLSPQFLDLLPKSGSFDVISQGYMVALERGLTVASMLHDGFWHDLRTPLDYWLALKDLVTAPGALAASGVEACRKQRGLVTRRLPSVLLDASSRIGAGARLLPLTIVEPGCTVGDGALVQDSVLLPGAVVQPREVIRRMILGAAGAGGAAGFRVPLPIQAG